jgi:hypothetical protein
MELEVEILLSLANILSMAISDHYQYRVSAGYAPTVPHSTVRG